MKLKKERLSAKLAELKALKAKKLELASSTGKSNVRPEKQKVMELQKAPPRDVKKPPSARSKSSEPEVRQSGNEACTECMIF